MQLRSGRRLVSPQGGQRRRRLRPSPPSGDEEDRLSCLSDDVLLEVLRRLGCAREAARTSVLSRRWCALSGRSGRPRGLWNELRELRFHGVFDPDSFDGAVAQVRQMLNHLYMDFRGRTRLPAARVSSLLRTAAGLEPADLVVNLLEYRMREDIVLKGPFELPCFKRTTSMELRSNEFTLPEAAEFTSLEQLSIDNIRFFDQLGVLLPCCPRLRKLQVNVLNRPRIDTITVESKSLEELDLHLSWTNEPTVVVIAAPELKKLIVGSCFGFFTVSLMAPNLEEFSFRYVNEHPRSWFGNIWRLWSLRMATEYSNDIDVLLRSRVCVLSLTVLATTRNSPTDESIAQEITRLPVTNFSVLQLHVRPEGHAFETLVFRTSIQTFKLFLMDDLYKEFVGCSESCDCNQPINWRNQQISLPDLEVVEIGGFAVVDHEVDLLRLLFRSTQVSLDSVRCQELHSIFEANAAVKCSIHERSAGYHYY